MTTISAHQGTLDTSAPPVPSSLVQHAFEAAGPRSSEWVDWQDFPESDRADAIGALAVAIRKALPLLSPIERHEFAAVLKGGINW